MKVDKTNINNQVNFGYSNILKTLFKEGEMPSVTRGIYGHPIDNSNVTLEHLRPHSKGGRTILGNLALADRDANQLRSNKPLKDFLTREMLEGYLSQFNFRVSNKFNGFQYQEMIRQTCKSEGVGTLPRIIIAEGDSFVKQATPEIDYGSLKSIIENFEFVDFSQLSKKMLKSLRHRGLIN